MNPLQFTKFQFLKLRGRRAKVTFQNVVLNGIVTEIILAANDEHLPGSFDFLIEKESESKAKELGLTNPVNFGVLEVTDIEAFDFDF